MPALDPIILADQRGGFNDSPSPHDLRANELRVCLNVDLDEATFAGKRLGSTSASNGYAGSIVSATFLHRHIPSNDPRYAELWMAGLTSGGTLDLDMRDDGGWETYSNVSFGGLDDPIAASGAYALDGLSLHGKLFLAYPAASGGAPVDRLHVKDAGSTVMRRVGIREPAAPSVAATGSAGSYSGTRYARVRYVTRDANSLVTRRSEPSDATTFTPDGTKTGIVVTRPALLGEGETHWEVELSLDNVNFYLVSTVAIATGTYTDTTDDDTGYRNTTGSNVSPDLGDYELIWSAKYLSADEDRLLFAGGWVDANTKSRFGWTPVRSSTTTAVAANDERIETDTDPYADLDGFEGGEITGLKGPVNGYHYLFKESRIYQATRTGQRSRAYSVDCLTKEVGSLPGAQAQGVDEYGRPCLYFADAVKGPQRLGVNHIETIGGNVAETWKRVNVNATVPCRVLYYPEKRQVHYWIAVDGGNFPTVKLVLSIRNMRRTEDGTRGGWMYHTGKSAKALCACLYADNVASVPSSTLSSRLKPFIGLPSSAATGAAILQMIDTGVSDDGETYQGLVKTKGFLPGAGLTKFGVTSGLLIGEVASGQSVAVTLIRNYGLEEATAVSVSLTATGSEERVIRPLDDLNMSDLYALEVEVGDTAASSGAWNLDFLALQLRREEGA